MRAGCIILAAWTMGAAPLAAAPTPHVYRITIKDLAFGPAPAGIRLNDTVEWVNDDILLHSVTAQDKSFDVDVAPGKRVRIVMKQSGIIRYFCKYHPGMQAQLTVRK